MKNKILTLIITAAVICLALCGCSGEAQPSDEPDIGIDWDTLIAGISEKELADIGWYAEMDTLSQQAEEFGTVFFCNYDSTKNGAFKEVDYQFSIEYGLGCEYTDGTVTYYETPVYSIMLVSNHSDSYYACTYSEDFTLLSEEGEWFMDENREEYINACLENCRSVLFES